MKRGEIQRNFFRFSDRLPYFPFYRTIVLNVKVKIFLGGFRNHGVMKRGEMQKKIFFDFWTDAIFSVL